MCWHERFHAEVRAELKDGSCKEWHSPVYMSESRVRNVTNQFPDNGSEEAHPRPTIKVKRRKSQQGQSSH